MTYKPTLLSALYAIVARVQGVWDDPHLMEAGSLGTIADDVLRIAQAALEHQVPPDGWITGRAIDSVGAPGTAFAYSPLVDQCIVCGKERQPLVGGICELCHVAAAAFVNEQLNDAASIEALGHPAKPPPSIDDIRAVLEEVLNCLLPDPENIPVVYFSGECISRGWPKQVASWRARAGLPERTQGKDSRKGLNDMTLQEPEQDGHYWIEYDVGHGKKIKMIQRDGHYWYSIGENQQDPWSSILYFLKPTRIERVAPPSWTHG